MIDSLTHVRCLSLLAVVSASMLGGCPAPADGDDPNPGSSSADDDDDDASGTTSLPLPADSSTTGVTPGESSGSSTAAADESTSTTGEGFDDPGCPECIVLADGLMSGRGIAVDVDHVYWTDQEAGTVHRILKGGGDGGTLAADQDDPYDIAVSDGQVYWTNFNYPDGGVFSVPVTGGAPTLLSEEEYPRSIAVQGDQIYWGTFEETDGRVMSMTVGQAEPPTLMASVDGGVSDLVVDGDQVFFTAHALSSGVSFIVDPTEPAEGSVFVTSVGADPFNVAQLATDLAAPWGIAKQGDRIVWVDGMGDSDSQPRSVLSVPAAGGALDVLASGQTAPWGVAVDEQYAYWTDHDEVWAVPLDGGNPILLAEQQNRARSIVVDDQWVFWVTRERVLQRAKP